MAETSRRLVVAVRTRRGARANEVLRWLRWMVPAAVLLVAPGPPPDLGADDAAGVDDDVITIDADAVTSGPLSVAAALLREHGRR